MNIKIFLLFFLIIISSALAQTNADLKRDIALQKYFNQLNQRFLLNDNKSLEQVTSYLEQNNFNIANNPLPDSWLLENHTFQLWNSTSWSNDSSIVYNYNPDNLIEEIIYRDWSGSQWVNKYRLLYYYDSALRISNIIGQDNSTGSWIDTTKKVYSYDGQGELFTITTYKWNGSSWENSRLTTYTYSFGLLVREVVQDWSGNSWENSLRIEALYNSNFQPTNIVTSIWVIGFWLDLLQFVFYYNTAGYLDELRLQYWDFSGWANLSRSLATYDINYNIIENKTQDWDDSTSSWINYSRITYTYNQNNLVDTDLEELWTANNNWVNESLIRYSYDGNFNLEQELKQNWSSGNWINSTRELYNYVITSVEEISQTPEEYFLSQNYPNPFNPITTIQFQIPELSNVTLKIYNSIGEEVTTLLNTELAQGTYEIIWDANGFTSGVYYYQMLTDGFVETKKMTLLK